MLTVFNPADWYWQADDKRLFSSAMGGLVTQDAAAFTEWMQAGRMPTVWPRDEAGAQTDASLQAVLAPYGLAMNGKPALAPLTFMQFLALFTSDEQTAIVSSSDPQIRLFCLMAAGASGVDLSDPRTVSGTRLLETLKLIGTGRAAQVLAGQNPSAAQATA